MRSIGARPGTGTMPSSARRPPAPSGTMRRHGRRAAITGYAPWRRTGQRGQCPSPCRRAPTPRASARSRCSCTTISSRRKMSPMGWSSRSTPWIRRILRRISSISGTMGTPPSPRRICWPTSTGRSLCRTRRSLSPLMTAPRGYTPTPGLC